MVQKKYWEDLVQLRFQLFYLEEYNEHLLNNHLPYKKRLMEIADVRLKQYFSVYMS
jgi:hypothetical protein